MAPPDAINAAYPYPTQSTLMLDSCQVKKNKIKLMSKKKKKKQTKLSDIDQPKILPDCVSSAELKRYRKLSEAAENTKSL